MKLKSINLILLPLMIASGISIVSVSSCSQEKIIEVCENNINSCGNIAWFCFRFPKSIENNKISIELINAPQNIKLTSNENYIKDRLLDVSIKIDNAINNQKFNFGIKFNFFDSSKQVHGTINNLSVIYKEPTEFEKIGNDYADANQQSFYNSITYNGHDFFKSHCQNFYCNSDVDALFNYAYGPGYSSWNWRLHNGRGSTAALDNDLEEEKNFYLPGQDGYPGKVRLADYKYLDAALKKGTAGINVPTVYHGFEPDESDLKELIDTTLEVDFTTLSDEQIETLDVSVLNNKTYTDYGYLATTFDKQHAKNWAISGQYRLCPFLELTIDSDVNCGYLSYSLRKYGGFYLSAIYEYQLLINRLCKIKITNATKIKDQKTGKTLLYLKAHVSKQEYI